MLQLVTHVKSIDKLISSTLRQLKNKDINLLLSPTDYVGAKDDKSNGYFCEGRKTLAVSIGRPQEQWVKIFIHESCHFDQWVENCKEWRRSYEACRGGHGLFNWIYKSRNYTDATIKHFAEISRDLELDCERRTIKKMKEFGIPYNIKEYGQRAGAYIMFYNYMAETRKWYVIGKEPYNSDKILKYMPTNLNGEYRADEMTNKLRQLFAECVQ